MGRTDSKQFSNQNSLRVNRGSREEESSSVDNSVDIDLQNSRLKYKKMDPDNDNSVDIDLENARLKFLKMDPEIQQTECGQGLFKQSVGKLRKLDSGGNSEHQSSSEEGKRRKSTWREQTTECDVCGKEMLKS